MNINFIYHFYAPLNYCARLIGALGHSPDRQVKGRIIASEYRPTKIRKWQKSRNCTSLRKNKTSAIIKSGF